MEEKSNRERLIAALETYNKEWRYNSFLVGGFVSDLRKVADNLKIQWMKEIIQEHVAFLLHYEKSTSAFAASFIRLYDLQQFQISALNEMIESYAKNDVELFKTMVEKLKSK